jgi:hypothetical protein
VLRDVRQIDMLGSIHGFMNVAADSRFFVAIIGESYFLSRYCLYEFIQLCRSDLPIRTIPIFIGNSRTAAAQRRYEEHWRHAHRRVTKALAQLDRRHVAYLDPELDLLRQAPDSIGSFLRDCRAHDLPDGDWWLSWRCRYLIGAISVTFRPDAAIATNWTFSNPTIGGAGEDEPPLKSDWRGGPCHVHYHSCSQRSLDAFVARTPTRIPISVISVSNETSSPRPPLEPGAHVLLLDEPFLKSLTLCRSLIELDNRADVELVPIFLDVALTTPASEVPLLQWWTSRLRSAADDKEVPNQRAEIDDVLTRLGPILARLRDLLSPAVPV